MSNENPRMRINYDQILDTALKGVRRAYAFMALGVNAALDPEFKKYSLAGITQIQLLPEDLGAEAVQEIKTHFLTWVVGCGLRELIETFGVFLDQIFRASTQIAISYENYNAEQAEKDFKRFSNNIGIAGKLKELKNKFNIHPQNPDYIESINKARNCLTHRRGRLFAIIWAVSKSFHNRLISVFSGCIHFAIQRPAVESA